MSLVETTQLNGDAVMMNLQLALMDQVEATAEQNRLMASLLELVASGLTVSNFPETADPVAPVVTVSEKPFDSKAFAQAMAPLMAQFDQSEKFDSLNLLLTDLVKEVTKTRGVGSQSITSLNTRPLETAIKNVADSISDHEVQLDYAGGTTLVYCGSATNGSLTSAAVWQIQKLIYTSGVLTRVASLENQIWDNRASLSY